MNFDTWNRIHESFNHKKIEDAVKSIASQIESELNTKLYTIPEIAKFTRKGEPIQIGYLVTDDSARSMRLNFTEDDQLYSVDYWKAHSEDASITVYLHELPIDRALARLIAYYKNPVNKKIEEGEEDLTVSKPKPTAEADPAIKKAQKEMEYEFQDPKKIFRQMNTYVDLIIEGDFFGLLITGQAGVGKTHLVTNRLEAEGLIEDEDFVHETGRSTAAAMYKTLYEYNGKIIIFDDCDSVFKTEDGVNLLKGALDTNKVRKIAWRSATPLKSDEKEAIPQKFDFTGKVIFISNLPKKKIDKAIVSRSLTIEVALDTKDMLERMWDTLDELELPSRKIPSLETKTKALTMIEKATEMSSDVALNMRTLVKAISILHAIKDEDEALELIIQQCKD
jgi:hypothetical protein